MQCFCRISRVPKYKDKTYNLLYFPVKYRTYIPNSNALKTYGYTEALYNICWN